MKPTPSEAGIGDIAGSHRFSSEPIQPELESPHPWKPWQVVESRECYCRSLVELLQWRLWDGGKMGNFGISLVCAAVRRLNP
ncbi:hypothetical protein SDJN03_07436, partial [Cucurbita argyrosperma subsp. sororia]